MEAFQISALVRYTASEHQCSAALVVTGMEGALLEVKGLTGALAMNNSHACIPRTAHFRAPGMAISGCQLTPARFWLKK